MIREELRYFTTAVQFLTRLPVPHQPSFEPKWLDSAAKYFPLAGLIVGLLSALALLIASQLWTGMLPALIAVTAGIAITGAFHEDGFGDFFDALGGATPEARLTIMKDSRIGTYGTLALIFVVAAKVLSLSTLPPLLAAATLIAAHAGGRLAILVAIAALSYAGDPKSAKVRPVSAMLAPSGLAVAAISGLAPLLLLPFNAAIVGLLVAVAAAALLAWRARVLLGGYTGDVLGALEQSFEIAFLLGVAAAF